MWKRNPRLEDHLKSTNLVIFMKFWITLRWEGIVTTDMGNNRPESKTTLSCFFLWRLHIRQLIENQTSFCLSHTLNKTKFGIVFPHHQEEELHQYVHHRCLTEVCTGATGFAGVQDTTTTHNKIQPKVLGKANAGFWNLFHTSSNQCYTNTLVIMQTSNLRATSPKLKTWLWRIKPLNPIFSKICHLLL